MLRSRILTGLFGAMLAGVLGTQMASCTLDPTGTKPPVTTGDPCSADATCNDDNPCTTDKCGQPSGVCEFTDIADGLAPIAAQTNQDCLQIVCAGGTPNMEPDLLDVINDNNSCTEDSCATGKPTNEVKADGDPCTVGNKPGTCAVGMCEVSCMQNSECDDGNPCSDNYCDTGNRKCVFTYLDGVLTPGAPQVAADCKVRFCSNGIDGDVNDDADVNVDGNPCTDDICTAGVPSNPPFEPKTMCPPVAPSVTGVCDGAGTCQECVDKDDCTNILESECEKRSCVANKCVIAYKGQETDASPVLQADNDCKKVVCSGMAIPLTVTVNDDADLPDDGFQCTTDTCVNGVPTFTDKASGTMCGNGQVCNATGDCVGCNGPTDCMGTDDFCKTRTCTNNVCGFNYTANGIDLPMGQTAGDCKVLECDGAGNVKTSVLQSDVPVDNNQCTNDVCNAQGTPSNPPTAVNSMCSVGMNNACDGAGNCKKSLGLTCAANNECVSTRCVDGVCCNTSCTTLCESCNVAGSLGTCTAVPKGQDDTGCSGTTQSCNSSNDCDDENGVSCSANSACLSNNCIDGYCCNSTCMGTCRACNLTGTLGTCTNIAANSDPANECMMAAASTCGNTGECDGSGACQKYASGTVCAAQSCMNSTQSNADTCNGTGTCNDGGTMPCGAYACDMAMTACKTSCTTDMDCATGNYCMGTTCMPKKTLGQMCTTGMGNQCTSGNCVDGVCCDTMCGGDCFSCNASGTCTEVALGGTDGMCTGMNVCDGNGGCGLKNGQTCMANSACASGFCADGVCCNAACDTDCKVCNRAGSVGTCLNRMQLEDDNDPVCNGNDTCDGMGNCKLDNGQDCMGSASNCASGSCNIGGSGKCN